MTRYLVGYRTKGSSVFHGFDSIVADSQSDAIEKCKTIWIKDWNLAFPHKPDGAIRVLDTEFICQ